MPWFPDLATQAFCETVQLRKMILDRQQSPCISPGQVLEPASAEFIAALAAGTNCRNLLQIGVGLSTIALAAAARVTGGFLVSVQADKEKQEIVHYHMEYLGLLDFVEFIVGEPCDVISRRQDVDFAFLMGDPKEYIKLFDLLNLKNGAIVAADNALNEACNDYIRHVRQQPGVDSSTLPLARGIEVTKMVSWEKFISGRIIHTPSRDNYGGNDENMNCSQNQPSLSGEETIKEKLSVALGPAVVEVTDTSLKGSSPISGGPDLSGSVVEEPEPSPSGLFLESGQGSTMERENEEISQPLNDLKSPSLVARTEQRTSFDCTDSLSENAHSTSPFTGSNGKQDSEAVESSSLNIEEVTPNFEVEFKNHSAQTEVLVTGIDQDMLLTDITMAFNDMRVSVKRAKISTRDKLVEDVFYVVDGKTRGPIHPSQWDAVKARILQRIGSRKGPGETQND